MLAEPTTLEGKWVRLEPLRLDAHAEAFCRAIEATPDLVKWFSTAPRTRPEMLALVKMLVKQAEEGLTLPWATVERTTGQVVGGTAFLAIERSHRRVEIGWTWIAPKWQRSKVNTEAKLLQFTHAFETLGCIRVELKTDALNEKSRKAIERLGAREEGVFRSHMIMADGRVRDTAYYSVIAAEWSGVQARLRGLLYDSVCGPGT
jgi:RimJ/RimL family protein N-acetyltransferase